MEEASGEEIITRIIQLLPNHPCSGRGNFCLLLLESPNTIVFSKGKFGDGLGIRRA